jgi:hypothetical protein
MSACKAHHARKTELCASSSAFGHGAGYDPGVEPPASVAAVAARWLDRLQLLEVEFGNGVQLSASLDPARLAGKLSRQARYSSCRSISAATAAAQRLGRGGVRRASGAGGVWFSRRSRARRRAWRWAGVIGTTPMRSGHVLTPAAIVTVTFASWLSRSLRQGIKSRFLCSIEHRFSVPTWVQRGAARSRGQD